MRDSRPRHQQLKLGAREKLLDASLVLVREKGYSATSVEELCAKAGVTKGAFFHHFESKEALAVAAANRWSELSSALFKAAPYHKHRDPLDRAPAAIGFSNASIVAVIQIISESPRATCTLERVFG